MGSTMNFLYQLNHELDTMANDMAWRAIHLQVDEGHWINARQDIFSTVRDRVAGVFEMISDEVREKD